MSSEMEPVTAEQVIQGLRYDWPNKTFGEWELIVPLAPDVFHPEDDDYIRAAVACEQVKLFFEAFDWLWPTTAVVNSKYLDDAESRWTRKSQQEFGQWLEQVSERSKWMSGIYLEGLGMRVACQLPDGSLEEVEVEGEYTARYWGISTSRSTQTSPTRATRFLGDLEIRRNVFTNLVDWIYFTADTAGCYRFERAAAENRRRLERSLRQWERLTGGEIITWSTDRLHVFTGEKIIDGVWRYGIDERAYTVTCEPEEVSRWWQASLEDESDG